MRGGVCTYCGCYWDKHVNSHFIFMDEEVNVTYDCQTLKAQYGEAFKNMSNSEILLNDILEKQIKTIEDFE